MCEPPAATALAGGPPAAFGAVAGRPALREGAGQPVEGVRAVRCQLKPSSQIPLTPVTSTDDFTMSAVRTSSFVPPAGS